MSQERRKGFLFGMLAGAALLLGVISGARYFGIQLYISGSATQQVHDKAKVIERCIDDYYQGEVKDEELANGAAKGMVSALGDKYSQYYTEEEYEELMNGINGSYVGIGVSLKQEEDGAVIVKDVSAGGPAAAAGIEKGDRFVRVDGREVADMSMDEMIAMIKKEGNDGRTITITVERAVSGAEQGAPDGSGQDAPDGSGQDAPDGAGQDTPDGSGQSAPNGKELLDLQVVCGKVDVVSVSSKKFGTVGYIKITEFDKETDEQFGTAIENMKKDDVSGLVIDVRDNGGGSLDSVIKMLDEILPKGELITEKSKKEGDKTYHSTDDTSFDRPVAVLINGNSASASEVFAGTLQARKAATLVGTQSFGKGIVQTVLSLEGSCGGGIKLTTAEYFLPGGISIHKKGLAPDIEVEASPDAGKADSVGADSGQTDAASQDNQLQRALELLNGH